MLDMGCEFVTTVVHYVCSIFCHRNHGAIKCLLNSYSKATRGLLATDLVILSLGEVTKKAPEMEIPSTNLQTIPTGDQSLCEKGSKCSEYTESFEAKAAFGANR
ncbi:hypothetical protein TNCV_4235711 [Trichonephila clavipes]|nr:hypothetical protein TNCV_4235711 [Trichonephila clavipes]